MEQKALPEVCHIQYGYPFDSKRFSDKEGFPLIRIRDVVRGHTETFTTESCNDEYIVKKGDILIGMDGMFNVAKWKGNTAYLNQRVCKIEPNSSIVADYLFYYLPCALKKIENKTAFVTVKHLKAKQLNSILIPCPPVKEQKRIAQILDLLFYLICQKKKQLNYLDELVKSRFIEMFGDPQSNCYNWKIVPLKDVMVGGALNGYFTKPQNYDIEGNVGVICVSDVVNRKYTNVNALRRAFASEKDLQKYCVKYGDMLFCRSSLVKEGIGKASIIPPHTENDILFECHVIKITLDMSRVIPEYLQALSITDFFRIQVIRQSKTATMTTIGQKDIASVNILLPPMELQKRFTEFSAQIDKSKLAVQKSLDELETLKKSLMQTYFG